MSEIPESKKPRKSIGRNIVDEWDLKHFKRVPVANSSFQYEIREDLIKMIDSEIEQLQKQNEELIEALKFYADGLNYESVYEDDEMDLHIKIDREDVCFDEDDQYFGYAGDFARKTLAKFSKGI